MLRRVTYQPMLEEVRYSQRRLVAAGLEDAAVLAKPAEQRVA